MRILNVNSSLSLNVGGGTAERTFQMSRFLAMNGVDCTVLTIDTGLDEARLKAIKPANVIAIQSLWKRFNIPRISWREIKELVKSADIVHLMGHWSVLNAIVYLALRSFEKPYVVCPAGALPIFGRSKIIKKAYNIIVGRDIIRNAAGWIAVTSSEFPHFENYGISASQVTVIPNGICREDFPVVDTKSFRVSKALPNSNIILFMGRLSPIKGPDLLLKAFALVQRTIPEYHLVFAGPDDGMQSYLSDIIAQHEEIRGRVHFVGFLSGEQKSAAYRSAKLLVVPSRQEAMSIVALEAGICGTPVLLTDQCGFGDIRLIDSRLEVQASVDGLATGLTALLSDVAILKQVAPVWQAFVERRYTWQSIIKEYIILYNNIVASRVRI